MKVILIGKPQVAGYLSDNAVAFLKEKGFAHEDLTGDYPALDIMKRNNPLLVEAVEKYGEEMPYLEIVDVPLGKYAILGSLNEQSAVTETLVKEGCYWLPSCSPSVLLVETDAAGIEELNVAIALFGAFKRAGINYIAEIEAYTRSELVYRIAKTKKDEQRIDEMIEDNPQLQLKAE